MKKKTVFMVMLLLVLALSTFGILKYLEKNGDNMIATNQNKEENITINENIEDKNKVSNNENKSNENNEGNTPVQIHGSLNVNGTNIVDKNNNIFVLKGVSTHGIAWFPQYVNKETFKYMRDEWNINVVRLAMYTDPNVGYTKQDHELVKKGVEYATELGLYVIIDWHILSDNNPNIYKQNAIAFFEEMATLYKDNINVIYEICNEPNGNVTWQNDIKPYANEVIGKIRSIDDDAIIICGTPNWSQDVDVVSYDPIEGYNNIVYALHFYAATHKDDIRAKASIAIQNGLPIIVSEFSICDAAGSGNIDLNEANKWMDFLNNNNIGYIQWNLSNKNETSALLLPSVSTVTNWTENDLSTTGKWLVQNLTK